MPAELDFVPEWANVDFDAPPVADIEAIRAINPHRHELELLSAVVTLDPIKHVVYAYKDLPAGQFWERGHFPRFAVFPGVLMCEAGAQLCNFYTVHTGTVTRDKLMGLGGLDGVRIRSLVRPGDRLHLVAKGIRISSRMTKFAVFGAVKRAAGFESAFEATVIGVPLGTWEDLRGA
jgi:3-hydroxyacyl-[acyl-carrier-protein] dehydratase